MKAPFSSYLDRIVPGLKQLLILLGREYPYVSVLSTDSAGFAVRISQRSKSVSEKTMTTERGSVVRVWKDGRVSEVSFNRFDPDRPEETAQALLSSLRAQRDMLCAVSCPVYTTPPIPDEACQVRFEADTEQLPENTDMEKLIDSLTEISDSGMEKGSHMIDLSVSAQSTHISKLFLTANRDMRQSYVYSEGSVSAICSENGRMEVGHEGLSGRRGPEIFSELTDCLDKALSTADELLRGERVVPGEYDIITTPEVTGLIAHEAFGHGVEMDMFVKNRALGSEYIGRRIASPLVTMHEGALCAESVTAYAFDDEGTLAGDVTEIEHGILKSGICDTLSALRLGCAPTGNGKRENYEHKAYTRMTNTLFDSGDSTLEEMIASVRYGYLLSGMQSGMEDPKHWGIQCIIDRGYEIRDGKLTGKIVTPVIMTGYVPDLLGSVTMVSRDREVFGNGGCGKGHKEWVKVADGGPCLKARARLG